MGYDRELASSPAVLCKVVLLTASLFGSLIGICFTIWKDMPNAMNCFLIMNIVSSILQNTYVDHMNRVHFTKCYRTCLKGLLVCGFGLFASTLAYAICLLIMATRNKEEFSIQDNSFYFAFVPCLISNLLSALLIYETRRSIRMSDGGSTCMAQKPQVSLTAEIVHRQ